MHLIHKTILGSFFVLSPLSLAIAAESNVKLPTINTVANLTEQENSKTLAAVTVIDRKEIERKQFNSLQDILKTIPGVSMRNYGGMGKGSSISLRGTGSTSVLVLVDGRKVGSATTGQAALEHFPIDQIERIEVVSGPRSSLYGSEAIGGVIQIFTRSGTEEGVKPFGSFKYGSHETYDTNLGVNLRKDNSWATVSLAHLKTQGFNVVTSDSWGYDPDKDGYENKSLSVKAGHQFNDQFAIDANLLQVRGENEYDSGSKGDAYGKIDQNVYGLGLSFTPNSVWTSKLNAGRAEDKLKSYESEVSAINTQRDTLTFLNTLSLNTNNTITLGTDYQKDEVKGNIDYILKDIRNNGYFAQYIGTLNNLSLQGSIRLDDHSEFGDHTTGNISLGYDLTANNTVYVSYGTAFRAPTINDLYLPVIPSWMSVGNPDLKPEESENIEVGYKGRKDSFNWQLTAFQNEIENLIKSPFNPVANLSMPINIAEARIRGVELAIGQNYDQFSWNMNYTYQEPKNRSDDKNYNKQLVATAKQLLNVSADYSMDKWTVGASVHGENKRFSNEQNTANLGSFATADTRVTYQATPEFSIQAKLENMFDKQYQTYSGYNQDGRTAWVTLRYAMK